MNKEITPTKFSDLGKIETVVDVGNDRYKETLNTAVFKKSILDELEKAVTKLEGYAVNVNNCDCVRTQACQTLVCQGRTKGTSNCDYKTCQTAKDCNYYMGCQKVSCQYMTCQKVICQAGISCQACQACEFCQECETCESQCLCQTCQSCQQKTYEQWSCQTVRCESCQTCQTMVCENILCQANMDDGKDLLK